MVATQSMPVFTAKKPKKRVQLRFWADEELFKKFRAEAGRHELKPQEAFEDFMIWFVSESEKGHIKFR